VANQILPEWKSLRVRVDEIAKSAGATEKFFEKLTAFMRERQLAWEAYTAERGVLDVAKVQEFNQHWAAANKILAELNRGG
jgi:hypothetical protein